MKPGVNRRRANAATVLAALLAWSLAHPARAQVDTTAPWRWVQQVLHQPLAVSTQPHPAVVRVVVPDGTGSSLGSGTLVDVNDRFGLVLTNWHVIADATGVPTVVFPDGFRSAALVVKSDRDWDLAALVIWRPRVAPVPLSNQVPQPGELLTIAGYGSGNYRAATGRCTQFVSPGREHPAEMVELSAAARQGDSGGPIFNQRGELAGVLFGASFGTTSGSHCQRVRRFLQGVLPTDAGTTSIEQSLAAATGPAAGPPEQERGEFPRTVWQPPGRGQSDRSPEQAPPACSVPPAQPAGDADALVEVASDRFAPPSRHSPPPHSPVPDTAASAFAAESTAIQGVQPPDVFWQLFGATRWEQTKSVLALLALILITLQAQGTLGSR